MWQPGQTPIHTYTHCVMRGDDCLCDTLTKADAELIADAPAMRMALQMVMLGIARIEKNEFCLEGIRIEVSYNEWSKLFFIIGWDRARRLIVDAGGVA